MLIYGKCFVFCVVFFSSVFSYNKRQLSRIYPKGGRVDSSNFMPQVKSQLFLSSITLLFLAVDHIQA